MTNQVNTDIQVKTPVKRKKIASLGKEIMDGNIAMQPTELNHREACTYCRYKEICGFDTRLPGYKKKECGNMEPETIWSEIRESV